MPLVGQAFPGSLTGQQPRIESTRANQFGARTFNMDFCGVYSADVIILSGDGRDFWEKME